MASFPLKANEFNALRISKTNRDFNIAVFKNEELVSIQNSVLDFNHDEYLLLGNGLEGATWSIQVSSDILDFVSQDDISASPFSLEQTQMLQHLSVDWHKGDLKRFSQRFEEWPHTKDAAAGLSPFQQQLLLHISAYLHKTEQHKHTLSVLQGSGFPKLTPNSEFEIHANQLLAQSYLELNQFDDALKAYLASISNPTVNQSALSAFSANALKAYLAEISNPEVNQSEWPAFSANAVEVHLAEISHPKVDQLAWTAFSANALSATALINILRVRECGAPESELGKLLIFQAQESVETLGNALLNARLTNRLWSYMAICERFYDAELLIERALNQSRGDSNEHRAIQASLLNHLGFNHRLQGDVIDALEAQRKAFGLIQHNQKPFTAALSAMNLANLYLRIGDYAAAKTFFESLLPYYEGENAQYDLAMVLMGLATIAEFEGDTERALNLNQQAFDVAEENDDDTRARLQLRQAMNHIQLSERDQAEALLSRHLLDKGLTRTADKVDALLAQAALLGAEGKQEIFRTIHSTFEFSGLKVDTKLNVLRAESEFYYAQGDASAALIKLEQALEIVENIRASLDVNFVGPAWVNQHNHFLQLYIEILLKLEPHGSESSDARIFSLIEQHYVLNTRKRRHNMKSDNNELVAKALTKEFEELLAQERNIVLSDSHNATAAARTRLSKLREQILLMESQWQSDDEVFVASLHQVINGLKPGQVMLRYFIAEDRVMVFVLSEHGWQLTPLVSLQAMRSALVALYQPQNGVKGQRKALNSLQSLIPVEVLTTLNAQEIVVVPEAEVHLVPFSAIDLSHGNGRYMPALYRWQFRLTLSASSFLSMEPPLPMERDLDIAIFADPYFPEREKTQQTLGLEGAMRNWARGLKRLPHTASEAQFIAGLFPKLNTELFVDRHASKAKIMSKQSRHARILHIASHGYFNEATPDIVGLATASESDSVQAGFLSLRELLSSKFTSELVVVNGCETNLGALYHGEGLYGLTRGLISQGASNVISTLWPVPDKPSALFMKAFYTNLKRLDGDIAEAMHHTQKDFARSGRYRDPRYWAGFVLTTAGRQYARVNLGGAKSNE